MKNLLSVLIILCWLTLPAQAQRPGNGWGGQLEAMKTTFITTRLRLTPEEAEKFWPIYNQYAAEVKQAVYNHHHNPNSTELEFEKNLLAIREKYAVEFHKAIPFGKINDFFIAEKDFNRLVQQEANRRRGGIPGPPPPGP
jgi:hypothetical protein